MLFSVALLAVGAWGPAYAAARSLAAEAPKPNLKTVRLPIEGMACPVCVARVRRTLKLLDGVLDVEVRLEQQAARVTFDANKISADQLAAAVNRLGYRAGTPQEIE